MAEKKRKAPFGLEQSASKKRGVGNGDKKISVKVIPSDKGSRPIIASTPGISLPSDLEFDSYTNGSELLLQSSAHPTIDFTGTEDSRAGNVHLSHYVAVYDPATDELQLIEARELTVRGQVRPRSKDDEDQEQEEAAAANSISNYTTRAALTQTFGTKKSKKAVRAIAENALLPLGANGANGHTNNLSSALLSAMPEDNLQDGGYDVVQESKPLPHPNLEASTPDQAYSIASLVFPAGENTLRDIDVSDWQTAASNDSEIKTRSRFVASRVEPYALAPLNQPDSPVTSPEQIASHKRLRLLRYFLILLEFSLAVAPHRSRPPRDGYHVPPTAQILAKLSDPKPTHSLIEGIRRKFVPATSDNKMRSFEIQLLHTTICALTLHLPSRRTMDKASLHWATEPSEIRDDLGLDDKTIRQYFKELGCKVDKVSEADAQAWGVKKKKTVKTEEGLKGKGKGPDIRIAKLRVPLQFPKRGGGNPHRAR